MEGMKNLEKKSINIQELQDDQSKLVDDLSKRSNNEVCPKYESIKNVLLPKINKNNVLSQI